MGLNLNIGRVIFSAMDKYDGEKVRALTTSETLQIGGRAGRFGTEFSEGYVSCMRASDLKQLRKTWKRSLRPVLKAGVLPHPEAIRSVATARPDVGLGQIFSFFKAHADIDKLYFHSDVAGLVAIANLIENIPLQWEDRLSFCLAPVRHDCPIQQTALTSFAIGTTHGQARFTDLIQDEDDNGKPLLFLGTPGTPDQLKSLELSHAILDSYLWLGQRLGQEVFIEIEQCAALRLDIADKIQVKTNISRDSNIYMFY